MKLNTIYNENCRATMARMPDGFIDCCITSPPYYGLRDYGRADQIGLEETPEQYVQKLVEVFREVKRVLKPEGTLWLNLGDSYCGSTSETKSERTASPIATGTIASQEMRGGRKERTNSMKGMGIKPKDLIGIPWMVAFALRADGWYLRQDIIWHKPNPMPESVTDRCTKSHEYVFLMSKSQKYYYDGEAIKEPFKDASIQRLAQNIESQKGSDRVPGKTNGPMKAVRANGIVRDRLLDYNSKEKQLRCKTKRGEFEKEEQLETPDGMANKKSVWSITTKPYKGAHFATFPEGLIVPMVKAGCPEKGIIYDPFGGAATTGLVSHKLDRNWIISEISKDYCNIGEKRLQPYLSQHKINWG